MNGLPQKSRLRLKSDFDLLFTGGKSLREFPIKAIYLFRSCTPFSAVPEKPVAGSHDFASQVAFVVPKKLFKKATDRNRIKRLMREAWRLHVQALNLSLKEKQNCLKTLLIFTGKELPDYAVVSSKIILILQRLLKENEMAADQDSAGPDSHL